MSVVGILTYGIGVMDQYPETRARVVDRRVLHHRLVAVAVTNGEDRTPTDELMDPFGFARLIVDEHVVGRLGERRPAVAEFVLDGARRTDDLLRRNPVARLREHPHEIRAATGDDMSVKSIRAQIVHQFELRSIRELIVG